MSGLRRRVVAVAKSDTTAGRLLRTVVRGTLHASLPLPRPAARLYRGVYEAIREVVYWVRRVFIAEPIFRGYATRVGRNFKAGVFVHWITGDGVIVVGDDSRIDGKCSIMFAWSVDGRPAFEVGDRTHIGHDCHFTISRLVRIGDDCMFASGVRVMDSSAHPVDPDRRLRGEKVAPSEIRPVIIGNNVWIGSDVTILPGVEIGDGSVIAAGAVLTRSIPPRSVAAGVPAKVVRSADETPVAPVAAPVSVAGPAVTVPVDQRT